MKHIKSLVLLIFLVLAWKAQATSFTVKKEQSAGRVSFHLSQPDKGLRFSGLERTSEVSKAILPFKAFFINARPEELDVVIETGELQDLGEMALEPYLPRPCRCNEVLQNQFVSETFLQSDPGAFYKLEYLGDLRGVPLTRLLVFPVRLQAGVGQNFKVHLFPELNLQVSRKGHSVSLFSADQVTQWQTRGEQKMLMVAPERHIGGLQAFVDYKSRHGIPVTVKSFESIGGTKEGLAEFIKTNQKFTHVLIVGHENIIPTYYLATEFEAQTPSDLPYFTFGGEGDTIADVFYGRIASDSSEEIARILQKSMAFEQLPFADYKKSLGLIGIASNEGQNPSDKQYLEGMMTPLEQAIGVAAIRFHQDTPFSTPENINKRLSLGAYWLSYIGHGSGYSWPSIGSRPYEVADILNIQASKVLPVIVDVACQNGRFRGEARLGESFMNARHGETASGARAYYGGTVDISWDPPAIMSQGISRFVAKSFQAGKQGSTTISEALWAGQLHLMETHSDLKATTENRIWYHLQGDPTMLLSGAVRDL
ncbi:MAG: hypothetical protein HYV97_07935 [Bdellovibrio sp.]|nr:hypothetical protein [Bdellovibrio sp.]